MTNSINRAERPLLVGFNGGVGRAVLALLENSRPGRELTCKTEKFYLVDQRPSQTKVTLKNTVILPPISVGAPEVLAHLIREHQITQVIDLSSTDTIACASVCEEEGADFLCTSVEEWPERVPVPTDQAIAKLLPPQRPAFAKQSHLVGSGANPGIVNALAFAALNEFAKRLGKEPTTKDLDLHSVLITEEDTTKERGAAYSDGVFPMTWSPAHCLEELFEPRSFSARSGRVLDLGHRPTERWYKARCGESLIEGMAVPHEETKTLARRLDGVEIAFIYRIPATARKALSLLSALTPDSEITTRRLCPPTTMDLTGYDRVGVLLCSRQFGEFWMGFETDVAKGLTLGTNATQLQVATGVISGWSQLGQKKGIHFVEDLNWQTFISTACEVLGQPIMVHDPAAPPLSLRDRV